MSIYSQFEARFTRYKSGVRLTSAPVRFIATDWQAANVIAGSILTGLKEGEKASGGSTIYDLASLSMSGLHGETCQHDTCGIFTTAEMHEAWLAEHRAGAG